MESHILISSRFTFGKSPAVELRTCKSRPTPSYCHRRFKNNRPSKFDMRIVHHTTPTTERNWVSKTCARGLWDSMCSNFKDSWRWASRVISFYLFCLNLVAEACHYPAPSFTYACEDVNTYYANTENLEGKALKKKLNRIIAPHHSLSYKEVWDALKILDAADVDKPEASSGIVEIYSLRVVPKRLAGKPEGWNSESAIKFAPREHLWPRSYGLTDGPSLTDIHNIRPSDVNVNSSRGNKYYGPCHFNSTKCLRPANREAALDTETDRERWAPPVKVRGDIARALLYMAICYGFHPRGGGPDLRLSDSPSIGNREMGLLSILLEWNEVDPPSREEKMRNERICRFYQHNRNPFVDHPEFANLIWKHVVPSR
ncbi:Extracellular ribonuclease [Morella rubra]|uniref:Extracellular ribonuclease n=1 Tax=Morella rubra TaxID=262757 RepID=A0A6A1UWW4_9ROSI|nr:Extracellular ribonuclease [Morella rubra]